MSLSELFKANLKSFLERTNKCWDLRQRYKLAIVDKESYERAGLRKIIGCCESYLSQEILIERPLKRPSCD